MFNLAQLVACALLSGLWIHLLSGMLCFSVLTVQTIKRSVWHSSSLYFALSHLVAT